MTDNIVQNMCQSYCSRTQNNLVYNLNTGCLKIYHRNENCFHIFKLSHVLIFTDNRNSLFNIETINLQQGIDNVHVYVKVYFICMDLVDMRETQSKINYKMKILV